MNDRCFEVRAFGSLGLDKIGNLGHVLDDGVGHPAANRRGYDRVAELQPEEVCRIGPGSTQVMMYSPLNGRNGRRGVLRQTPLSAKDLSRSISGAIFDIALIPSLSSRPDS